MNYMRFTLPDFVTLEHIQEAIKELTIPEYTKGDIDVQYVPIDRREMAIQFFFHNESSYIPGEIAHHTFHISPAPDQPGLQVTMAEIIGGNTSSVGDSVKYFMYITFEYLAKQFNVDCIDSDGLGEHLPQDWLINRVEPNMSMSALLEQLDNQRPFVAQWARKIKHFFIDNNNRWSDSPMPFGS